MSVLHLFDMDGTLLRGSTASIELGRRLGCLDTILEFEHESAQGRLNNWRFHEACLPLWERATEADVTAAFLAAPWMEGLREVWADIAARGEHSAVISMSPSFWVERLRSWGAGSVHATEVVLGAQTIDRSKVLTGQSKVIIADRLREKLALERKDCIAYGDSRSDLELFSVLQWTVAVNGNPEIERLASVAYWGSDLRVAYAFGRGLLEQRAK